MKFAHNKMINREIKLEHHESIKIRHIEEH